MSSIEEGLDEVITSTGIKLSAAAMAVFLTASSLMGISHAQEDNATAARNFAINTSVPTQPTTAQNVTIDEDTNIAFVPSQPQAFELNTNPLNIRDSHWVVMKNVTETIGRSPNPQVFYRAVILDDKGDNDPSNDELDRQVLPSIVHFGIPDEYWTLSNRTRPPTMSRDGVTPNITTLDDYVQRLAMQEGKTGVYIGVIGDGSRDAKRRLINVTAAVQSTVNVIKRLDEEAAPFVAGIFEVLPTAGEMPYLSEEQKDLGLILYVRGTRYGDLNNSLVGENGFDFDKMREETTLGTGIYVNEDTFLLNLERIWRLGLTHLDNEEYATYIRQELEKLPQYQNMQNFGSTGGAGSTDTTTSGSGSSDTGTGETGSAGDSSSDSGEQSASAEPVALNFEN